MTMPSDKTRFPRVYIATTGGPCRIDRITPRPQIRSSFVSSIGSFQPLPWSADYDAFIRNVLPQAIPDPGPFNLSVEDSPDFGRSWELPVLIAHLLLHHDRSDRAIWATGRLNADLSPVPADDYEIAVKIAQSREILADLGPDGLAILPPPLSDDERPRIEAAFAEIGCACAFPRTLAEVRNCLGLTTQSPKPIARRWPMVVATACAGLAAAATLVPWDANWPGPSTLQDIFPQALAGAPLSVQGIYAEEKNQCLNRFIQDVPLETIPATLSETDAAYRLPASPALCDLEFRNTSDASIELKIDPALIALGVLGSDRFTSLQTLGSRQYITIGLKRAPAPGTLTLWVDGHPFSVTFAP